jgi:N6-adenosine-specific RNA methylase IME4
MASCILYQNHDFTVILIDIPRSIELAQGASSQRLLSSKPIENPFPSVEPKSEKARANLGELSLDELLLQRYVDFALDQLKSEWNEKWCLPRRVKYVDEGADGVGPGMKRKRKEAKPRDAKIDTLSETLKDTEIEDQDLNRDSGEGPLYRNPIGEFRTIAVGKDRNSVRIPSHSTVLCGDIAATRDIFTSQAPRFDLIILDPPWPNRSARRKKSYGISRANFEIKELLSSIPIVHHVTEDGFVGVWVTNKPAFREMVLGIFEEWGVCLVEEWIWIKVTSSGETISELGSRWRKPYEILLVGRRGASTVGEVKRRILVGVPDLHSRKPNLKSVFEQVMNKEKYEALEIFARNLTAGWWAWGDEALKFQSAEYWIDAGH